MQRLREGLDQVLDRLLLYGLLRLLARHLLAIGLPGLDVCLGSLHVFAERVPGGSLGEEPDLLFHGLDGAVVWVLLPVLNWEFVKLLLPADELALFANASVERDVLVVTSFPHIRISWPSAIDHSEMGALI